jgi:hypothetical protein
MNTKKYCLPRKFIVKKNNTYIDNVCLERGKVLVLEEDRLASNMAQYITKVVLHKGFKKEMYKLHTPTLRLVEEEGWIIRLK